jgi:hypothetical protein
MEIIDKNCYCSAFMTKGGDIKLLMAVKRCQILKTIDVSEILILEI